MSDIVAVGLAIDPLPQRIQRRFFLYSHYFDEQRGIDLGAGRQRIQVKPHSRISMYASDVL